MAGELLIRVVGFAAIFVVLKALYALGFPPWGMCVAALVLGGVLAVAAGRERK